ncbi:granulocyte-macrophage colony-stimulating factor receptor subunit alpha-like [Meleagris gallopavo]|nr:granulocyte-macrophage colony-stimulating factor receptor subunit alpha-like [Meleagris gallopavo]
MFDALGLTCMICWCMMLFCPLHADLQCMGSGTQESPISNLTLNRRRMELSWQSSKNFSSYKCTMAANLKHREMKVKNKSCRFEVEDSVPLYRGAVFTVTVPKTNISKICPFFPEGINGSAIENFSCVIYDISLMNCTWHAGRNAPGDTQYFLYWQNSRNDDQTECELYMKDENDRNMGCKFQNVTIKDKTTYFLVNGSHKAFLIQFYDNYTKLYTIGKKLMPPSNVTVSCDKNSRSCTIQWQQPQINHSNKDRCFKYEVEITSKGNSAEWTNQSYTKEIITSHIVQNPNMGKKNLVKIRAAGHTCRVNKDWGEWSAAVEFGNEEISSSVWILPVVAVATLSIAIFTIFFCKRTGYWKAAFPQVPKPKDPFHGQPDINPQMMECKMQSVTSETEQIIVVAEVE